MIAMPIRTRPCHLANYIRTKKEVAELRRQVLVDGEPADLAAAPGNIARARGMTQLSRDTVWPSKSLYKSRSGERAPRSDTLFKVIKALGFDLTEKVAKDAACARQAYKPQFCLPGSGTETHGLN